MADGQLSVSLQADIAGFVRNMQAASTVADQTGSSVSSLSVNVSRNVAAINNTGLTAFVASLRTAGASATALGAQTAAASSTVTRSLAQAAAASATSGRAISTGSNQAAFALTNLGRVAQDAPFGFIGIQNNLNPLLESFQRLRAETGSNGAAFKALGQSLAGPAGIGIALSLVSAGVLLYQQYQQRANRETAAAASAMKNAKKSAEEYALTLDAVSQARLVGSINAQKELTELRTLYAITQDTTISTRQRGQAVDELQKKYPEYFKNIKDENFLNGAAKESYDRLTTSIIATARARAAQDIITKNSSRQLENQQKINDALIVYDAAARKIDALNKKRSALGAAGNTAELSGVTAPIAKALAKAQEDLIESSTTIRNLKTDTNILDKRNLDLTKEITNQVKIGADLAGKVGDLGSGGKSAKSVKSLGDVLKELNIDLTQTSVLAGASFDQKNVKQIDAYQKAIDELIKLGYKPASDAVEKLIDAQSRLFQLGQNNTLSGSVNQGLPAQRNSLGQTGLNGINVQDKSLDAFKRQEKEIEKSRAKIVRLVNDVNNILANGIGQGLSGFASGIGEALASGTSVIDAVGQGLLSGLGNILTQLGEAAIKIGVGLAAIKLALKSLNPFVAVAAGVGLIALGAFFSSKASSIGDNVKGGSGGGVTAFANGGVVYGPTNALIGEYAGAKSDPEVVAPLSKLKSIIGKGTNDNPKNNQTVQVGIEGIVKGKDLVLITKRVNESRT